MKIRSLEMLIILLHTKICFLMLINEWVSVNRLKWFFIFKILNIAYYI